MAIVMVLWRGHTAPSRTTFLCATLPHRHNIHTHTQNSVPHISFSYKSVPELFHIQFCQTHAHRELFHAMRLPPHPPSPLSFLPLPLTPVYAKVEEVDMFFGPVFFQDGDCRSGVWRWRRGRLVLLSRRQEVGSATACRVRCQVQHVTGLIGFYRLRVPRLPKV